MSIETTVVPTLGVPLLVSGMTDLERLSLAMLLRTDFVGVVGVVTDS